MTKSTNWLKEKPFIPNTLSSPQRKPIETLVQYLRGPQTPFVTEHHVGCALLNNGLLPATNVIYNTRRPIV